jgi:serine/threonine-protein kinase HipA
VRTLFVVLGGRVVGTFDASLDGRVSFTYDEAWRRDEAAFPLSLSLPKIISRHGGGAVSNWLWNLLPDNDRVLRRIAEDEGRGQPRVSARNPLALLAKIGEDCAGAVRLVRPDRMDQLDEGAVEWLDSAAIAARLRDLRLDRGSIGRLGADIGSFSLAGAQAKTALHRQGNQWGIPSGKIPTTHILKPPIPGITGQVENEHFCLLLAHAAGLQAVSSEVLQFGEEKAIVVKRYDRFSLPDGGVGRVHQEDMCQALAVHPERKYQADGGPNAMSIVTRVLAASSKPAEDRRDFMRALAFNFVIGGTDAHAKNYAIMFGRAPQIRLAPLYDINAVLPYPGALAGARMSMSIGKHAEFGRVMPRHWVAQARASAMDPAQVVGDVRDLIARCPDLAAQKTRQCLAAGIDHPVLATLVDRIAARCRTLATVYGQELIEAA